MHQVFAEETVIGHHSAHAPPPPAVGLAQKPPPLRRPPRPWRRWTGTNPRQFAQLFPMKNQYSRSRNAAMNTKPVISWMNRIVAIRKVVLLLATINGLWMKYPVTESTMTDRNM